MVHLPGGKELEEGGEEGRERGGEGERRGGREEGRERGGEGRGEGKGRGEGGEGGGGERKEGRDGQEDSNTLLCPLHIANTMASRICKYVSSAEASLELQEVCRSHRIAVQ